MPPIFQAILALQLGLGMPMTTRGIAPDDERVARSSLRAPTGVVGLAPETTTIVARISRGSGGAGAEGQALPNYEPTPEEWVTRLAERLDAGDARLTHIARWAARFPLQVAVGSGAVSMRLTLRTP